MKKIIETTQGANVYPAPQQMLIYQGKVLKDETTLEESAVAENTFIVIMLSKVNFINLSYLIISFYGSTCQGSTRGKNLFILFE